MSVTEVSHLIQAEDIHFDIHREGTKKSFRYVYFDGRQVDSEFIEEIESLVIPPNWKEVRIASNPNTHIRAYGFDDKERKQYIYHEDWRNYRDRLKFEKLASFAEHLPKIRRKAHRDLAKQEWNRNKTLGLIILTLDQTHVRIGNRRYLKRNSTVGATTLRRKHLDIDDEDVVFSYKAKSNKYRKVRMDNSMLSKLIVKCAELPGREIFTYKSRDGYKSIKSSEVNDYLKEITGEEFSAKNFRTWAGSYLAIEYLPIALEIVSKNRRKKVSTTLVRHVAKELGNTVAVCRSHYIHPKIMNAIEDEEYDSLLFRNHRGGKYALSAAEKKALKVITS
ncbi:MAG: DNA topoisomerase IB [Flavobacteriales bacterium]|nr:DNA topoisomerase IB [Flavobacteriales bacterium]